MIIEKALSMHNLTKAEIITILKLDDAAPLFVAADEARARYVGPDVHLRGLIEFSNYCHNNCLYCGLRCGNSKVKRYRMLPVDIIAAARRAKELDYKTVVLQSGEDPFYTVDTMVEIISGIKALGLAITLSIGEKTYAEYQAYKAAGADRYLLRIETTDKALYEKLDPGMSFENRLRCLNDIKALGFETGSGMMVGLPGQSIESMADDILFLKKLPVDMAGIGPFIANPDTPLAQYNKNNFELALRVMAITRLLLPDINIPATTAMETLSPEGRIKALQSGANVVMPNVTQTVYRELYQLYPGKVGIGQTADTSKSIVEEKIKTIGRTIGKGKGFRGEYLEKLK